MICSSENRARFISPPVAFQEKSQLRGWFQYEGAGQFTPSRLRLCVLLALVRWRLRIAENSNRAGRIPQARF